MFPPPALQQAVQELQDKVGTDTLVSMLVADKPRLLCNPCSLAVHPLSAHFLLCLLGFLRDKWRSRLLGQSMAWVQAPRCSSLAEQNKA
jgi:hypothetical protein